ncbi:MAG: hypothetical protein LBC40_08930 [Dysgonamonadaceae bacterium]|nr:hypothetical protein [Dysgonamonadaceae bacterium]
MKGHLRILETNVPVETQMEYFRISEKIGRLPDKPIPFEHQLDLINAPNASEKEKKYCLAALAHSGDVRAYRALEAYAGHPEPALKDWAAMALMEARVSLEAELSDEKQIFISTGLGGKGSKLRFFALMKSKKLKPFSPYQKDLIEREFPFQIGMSNGSVDDISVEKNYITLVFLLEISANIRHVLDNAIIECNQYGDFIDTSYLVTNVKIFSKEDIENELKKAEDEN